VGVYNDYRMCYGKKAYKYGTAQEVIKRRGEAGVELRMYHCPVCNKYHVTKGIDKDGKA